MFILENEKQIEKGLQKARQIKPRVRVLEFGKYAVRGSQGDSYTVRCSRTPHGEKAVECNLQRRLERLGLLSRRFGVRHSHRFGRAKTSRQINQNGFGNF